MESIVGLGVNIVYYVIGNISGAQLVLQRTTSIVNVMSLEKNASSKPLITTGVGAAIGEIIYTFFVPVPGVGTVLGYAAGGFVAGSFLGVLATSRNT